MVFSYFVVFIYLSVNFFQASAFCPKTCFCFSTSVSCVWSSLKSVPQDLQQNTTVLDLRYNKIEELTGTTFVNVANLETLLLNNNHIKALSRGVFKGLINLRILNLHQNGLKTIEPGTFENLHNLKDLYLTQNSINVLDTNVFQGLSSLTKLYLNNNHIKTIKTNIFPNLSTIENLRLDYNPLHCDCAILWLVNSLFKNTPNNSTSASVAEISGFCDEPASIRGKPLYDLIRTELVQECRGPVITVNPEIPNVHQKEGSSIFLECRAEGYTKPKITWKRNGVELDTRNKNYKFLPYGLKFQALSLFDEGVYECSASNEVGTAKAKPVTLQMDKQKTKAASEILTGEVLPSSVITHEGDDIQIDCYVKNKVNFPVTWFKNNLEIQEIFGNIKLLKNGTLVLQNINLDNSGKYDCVTIEPSTYIFGSCEVIVNSQPKIKSSLKNLSVGAGSTVELECQVTGHPTPIITWFRSGNSIILNEKVILANDNRKLIIKNIEESDAGPYTCMAQNAVGSTEKTSEIRVKNHGPRVPRIILRPFDIDVPQFSSIEIPCKSDGEPAPRIQWLKNRVPLELTPPKFKTNNLQSLRIYNVSLSDSGVYSCVATNIYGSDNASGTVTVIGNFFSENDEFIMNALKEAKMEVDRAINATINHLFAKPNKSTSPEFLMRIFRYPDEFSRNIVKPADVYSRTLANVRKHISSGLKLNITNDFHYEEVLSQAQLELIANLSGCVPHQNIANCSDHEFHSKYATFDGTCNNLQHPMWGSSYSPFRRILKPIYENGFNTPVGWNKDNRYHGFVKPHPRLVSVEIIRTYNITPDTEITHMLMQWGQFLDHDLDHALPSTTAESWEGLDCKKTCAYSEPCFPMEIPTNDPRVTTRRCMDFIRSSAVCGTGDTSVFFHNLHPREQLNQLTSYIDSSQIYGFTRDRSFLHRDLSSDLGLLRGGIVSEKGKPYLPAAGTNEVDCQRDLSESNIGCFLAGDIRVNEQVGLLAMQTIWFREHNRLATELKKVNPHWNGDTLYMEARKILNAEIKHITFAHWLPLFVGQTGMAMLGPYKGYNSNLEVSISNEFATAALRIGHTLINPELKRLNRNYRPIEQGHLSLGKAFFAPWRLVEEGGVDPVIRGLFVEPAKLKLPNQNLNDQLIEQLFTAAHAVSLDLAAMNIQRGRDHGLPGYMDYRRVCNLTTASSFEELHDISSSEIRGKLKSLYGHPENIDLWVGGVLEQQVEGARMGPLIQCLLVEQFKRLRDGDRFWYENPSIFTTLQLEEIRKTTLARVLCDNGDDLQEITGNVFLLPQKQTSNFVSCDNLPKIDIQKWKVK